MNEPHKQILDSIVAAHQRGTLPQEADAIVARAFDLWYEAHFTAQYHRILAKHLEIIEGPRDEAEERARETAREEADKAAQAQAAAIVRTVRNTIDDHLRRTPPT
jgi:hypothetical protein